jgi:Fe-S-cluster containining protein
MSSPCQSCGACCAYFRVSFYWRETEPNDSGSRVPVEWTEDVNSFKKIMQGTSQKYHRRCCALEGRIGKSVSCQIYPNRPSPCRNFEPSFSHGSHGQKNPRCDAARAAHGLPPLSRSFYRPPSLEKLAPAEQSPEI